MLAFTVAVAMATADRPSVSDSRVTARYYFTASTASTQCARTAMHYDCPIFDPNIVDLIVKRNFRPHSSVFAEALILPEREGNLSFIHADMPC